MSKNRNFFFVYNSNVSKTVTTLTYNCVAFFNESNKHLGKSR